MSKNCKQIDPDQTAHEVLLSSCKVILLHNFGLAALTFILL